MSGNETIIAAAGGLLVTVGLILKWFVSSSIKQQERITFGFLDTVKQTISAMTEQTEASRDVATALKNLTEQMCKDHARDYKILEELNARRNTTH